MAFDKDAFIQSAHERVAEDVDSLVKNLKLDIFEDYFPEILAGYRRWLAIAWMQGAGWGFEAGLEECKRLRKEVECG